MLVWWQQATTDFWSKCARTTREHRTMIALLALVLVPTIIAVAIATGMVLFPEATATGA